MGEIWGHLWGVEGWEDGVWIGEIVLFYSETNDFFRPRVDSILSFISYLQDGINMSKSRT